MRNLNRYIKLDNGRNSNFRYIEFIKSNTATRYGIDNIPNTEMLWINIENLVKYVLQPIRDKFGGIRITSGYRCLELNLKIGGSISSNHVYGLAADIEPIDSNISLMSVVNFIYNELEYKELILEYAPNGWVHVAYQKNHNKNVLKLKDDKHHYDVVAINKLNILYGEI